NHRRSTRRFVRAVLGFERDHEVPSLDAFRQRRIYDRRAAPTIRLKQARRDGSTAVGGKQPKLVDFLRGQRRQIAGEENQVAVATLIDRLTSRLRLIAYGEELDLRCLWIEQRRHDFVCLFELASLVV